MTIVGPHFALGPQWPTLDPFLFVAHHVDAYPRGNDRLAPDASTHGRSIGMDFDGIDGWNLYHGSSVPGFPQHPHRGFETITHLVRGHVDHSDSIGATARFGAGDTQWMTAGAGIVHAEMFPLLSSAGPNPLELFQIWLNLPAVDKLVDPYFTMLWREETPSLAFDGHDGTGRLTVIAGTLAPADGPVVHPLDPPPNSWAAREESEVAVWRLELAGDASVVLPPVADPATRRVVYVHGGGALTIGEPDGPGADGPSLIQAGTGVEVAADRPLLYGAAPDGGDPSETPAARCLVLQGRPIGEPVVQHGPFVMNDRAGIVSTIEDYQRTGFGGWPWPSDDPVHDPDAGRFARHADGRVDHPTVGDVASTA